MKEYPNSDEEQQIIDYLSRVGKPINKKMPVKMIKQVNIDLDSVKEYVFTYEGPPAQRRFCRKIKAMNKQWTKDEINQMSFRGENKKFGHKKQNYSIFKFKGGVNCKHHWNKWAIMLDEGGREYKVNLGKAEGKAGETASAANNYWKHPSNV